MSETSQIERFAGDLKTCIECGNCTLWCPVFQELPQEAYVARGKNLMIRNLLKGELVYDQKVADVLSKCTLCMTCTEHCPVQCQVQSTIIAARADQVADKGIGFLSKLIYRWLIPHRTLFGRVVRLASWFQVFLPKTEGSIRHLPNFLSAFGKKRQIPSIAPQFLRNRIPEVNTAHGGKATRRVGYFMGCATDFVFPEVGLKTIDFLNRQGIDVIVPKAQGCCGVPVWSGAGDFQTGRKMAEANVQAFADCDTVLVDCATCASGLKEYPKYLATPESAERMQAFADKVQYTSAFLVDDLKLPESAYQPSEHVRGKKVTWHDPCHANRYLNVHDQPRKILKALPGVEYAEMTRADRCCGMAGAFSLYHYDVSKGIADRKAETIAATGADIVATACPGCMMQLIDTMHRNHNPQKVMHLMDLLR